MLRILLFSLLVSISSAAIADDDTASFQVDNPAGWVMDNRVGVGQGANTRVLPQRRHMAGLGGGYVHPDDG